MNVVGWQSAVAGVGFLNASLIQGISALNSTSYSPTPWQANFNVLGGCISCCFREYGRSSLLPKVEGLVLIFTSWILCDSYPFGQHGPPGDATDVFTVFVNGGGWPTMVCRSWWIGSNN